MTRAANPYIAGNPVGNSTAFVGRDDVLQAVLGVLRDPQHHGVVLYGQRRIGKTSILQHLAEWLPKSDGPRAIYFDLQDKAAWPVGKIMVHLAETIADELGLATPEPGPEPETWFRETWLPPVLAGLPPGQALAVLFDEFDVLADTGSQKAVSDTFFNYLRRLLSDTAPRLRLVFVIGRNLEDLSYLAGPLFKTMPSKHVSLLLRTEAEALVRMSEAGGGLGWSAEAVDAAWALTSGHPYLLQHLCWQVWQRAHASRTDRKVSAADVEAAVPATLDASRNALEWLFQAGEGFYRAGKLDEAAAQLRQALGINPNHLKASEVLAELLIARLDLVEAQQVLERLRENYPAVARPRLVQVLLAKTGVETNEDARLALHDEVLKLDSGNARAVEGKQSIWIGRGGPIVTRPGSSPST